VITDSHSHLYFPDYHADRAAVLDRARAAGVTRQVVVGTDLASSRAALELCAGETGLFPSVGLHPHEAESLGPDLEGELSALARRPEVVAIGETGLDYFRMRSSRAAQRRAFRWHLALARTLAKPVIVHSRDAHAETVELLREASGVRGVMHCFSMGPAELPEYLELGLLVSFSGMVTYRKNDANREAARAVPLEALLVETDCPFLPPEGRRGSRNEPAGARDVLEFVARERGQDWERVARATSANAERLFALPPA
jgi:TatD DNase family protein